MQKSYWTHPKSSRTAMTVTLVLALAGVSAVEFVRHQPDPELRVTKAAAASLARQMMQTIKAERLRKGIEIDPKVDPAESGIIGVSSSITTSNSGHLPAKQTSINPNFAAVLVEMLHQAGVQEGDIVAVGLSGSFPALNICTCAALEKMNCRAILVASAAGSQWGANHPDLMWLDMERLLYDEALISFRSVAASLGGLDDQAADMTAEGVAALRESIARNDVPLLESRDYFESLNKRLQAYEEHADGERVAAYVNIGGGTVSVGTSLSKDLFRPGLNLRLPGETIPVDSVMSYFLAQETPVIHLSHIETLALRHGLPLAPQKLPRVAIDSIESPQQYNRWLAGGALAAVLAAMYLPTTISWTRNRHQSRRGAKPPESAPEPAEASL